jgi:uncharacterized membrane protein YuzA (DUF378 family)
MKTIDILIAVLLIVGGLNWGLVGLFNFDLVATLLGSMSAFSRIVYAVVGIAAIYQLLAWKSIRKRSVEAQG